MYGRIYDSRMGPYPPRVAWFYEPLRLSFHTVRRGIDRGDNRFRPRLVGVVDVWKDS